MRRGEERASGGSVGANRGLEAQRKHEPIDGLTYLLTYLLTHEPIDGQMATRLLLHHPVQLQQVVGEVVKSLKVATQPTCALALTVTLPVQISRPAQVSQPVSARFKGQVSQPVSARYKGKSVSRCQRGTRGYLKVPERSAVLQSVQRSRTYLQVQRVT